MKKPFVWSVYVNVFVIKSWKQTKIFITITRVIRVWETFLLSVFLNVSTKNILGNQKAIYYIHTHAYNICYSVLTVDVFLNFLGSPEAFFLAEFGSCLLQHCCALWWWVLANLFFMSNFFPLTIFHSLINI